MATTSASGRVSRRPRRIFRRIGLTVAAASLATALTAGTALADSYPTRADSQDFHSSAGNWVNAVHYEGLCLIPGVTCPQGQADWVSTGGAGGPADGYLRTRVATVAGTLSGVAVPWTSPRFTIPKNLAFEHALSSYAIRSNVAQLINLNGRARITTGLKDITHPDKSFSAGTRTLRHNASFAPSSIDIPTDKFVAGDTYRMILRVRVSTPLLSVPTFSEVDVDNVALTLTP